MLKVFAALLVVSVLSLFASPARAEEHEGKLLFHVVSLKFKQGTTKEQIKAVEEAFAGLKEKIPGIAAMTWGTNISPEKLNKGFTHCFVVASTAKSRATPTCPTLSINKALGKVLGPVLEDVFVIDFWGDVKHDQPGRADAGK
jgi:hypothetical protein